MNEVRYWLIQTWRGIRSSWLIQLAATGSMAVGSLLIGLAILGVFNAEQITRKWGRGIQVTVYLKPEAPPQKVHALEKMLRERQEVIGIQYVSRQEAYRRLEESLGSRKGFLDGVEKDFLPASLEISLNPEKSDQTRSLLALINSSRIVDETDSMGAWAERLTSIAIFFRLAGLTITLIVSLACIYIIGSTIRLGVYARRKEIDILKLVGAESRFIKAPFLIEGALQGIMGATVAGFLLYLMFRFLSPHVESLLAQTMSHSEMVFVPIPILLLGLFSGALIGVLGSRMALGRYVDG